MSVGKARARMWGRGVSVDVFHLRLLIVSSILALQTIDSLRSRSDVSLQHVNNA
jgi:hypothetical protein